MLRLKQIVFEDEEGKEFPVQFDNDMQFETKGDKKAISQIATGMLIGGGWNAITKFFRKPKVKP